MATNFSRVMRTNTMKMKRKINNLASRFNIHKAQTMKCRKKDAKRGYKKHKGKYE